MKKKTVCVIGLGYIGLPTAALLANKNFKVIGVDINKKIVSIINKGNIHIIEKDLDTIVKSAVLKGQLKAYSDIQTSDVYMICVPTPFYNNTKTPEPNLDYVLSSVKNIAPFVKSGDLVILESTSPVGTTEKIKQTLVDHGANLKDVHIAYCPERVLPGNIIIELIKNDRIIGGLTPMATKKIANFYRNFVEGVVFETDARTAEMCKLAENSYRDTNIAFANELSMVCDELGINVWNLIKLSNRHPRVNILQPSTGVGGHCIAVDPWFIISQDNKNTKLIRSAREVNNYKTQWVIEKIKNHATKHFLKTGIKPKILCLGLAFKPNIDDLRQSKAIEVAETLLEEGHDVKAVEPNINSHNKIPLCNFWNEIEQSDIICILVKHSEFLDIKVKKILFKYKALDFCGALN